MATVRLAGVVRESIVDGPGIRFTVFTQGCPHKCKGCHNARTHDFAGGYDSDTTRILAEMKRDPLLAGVTLSGGEPFSQPEPLAELAEAVRARGLSVMAYSGYTYEQLRAMALENPAVGRLLDATDTLVDGRFELAQRDLSLLFRGSRNQRIIDVAASKRAGCVVISQWADGKTEEHTA